MAEPKFPKWMRMCEEGREEAEETDCRKHLFDAYHSCEIEIEYYKYVVRIPQNVANGQKTGHVGVVLHNAGGAFSCNDPNYVRWFKEHFQTILEITPVWISIVAPLLPLHDAADMELYHRGAVEYIINGKLYDNLCGRFPGMKAVFDLDSGVLSIGESAGCHWALFAWANMPDLYVKAVYLLYPMAAKYQRKLSHKYRGVLFSEESLREVAMEILTVASRFRTAGIQELGRTPPTGMANHPMTVPMTYISVNGAEPQLENLWFMLFRGHSILDHAEARLPETDTSNLKLEKKSSNSKEVVFISPQDIHDELGDGPLRNLGYSYDDKRNALVCSIPPLVRSKPEYSPLLFIVHDKQDENCPIKDTDKFVDMHMKAYNVPLVYYRLDGTVPAHGFDNYDNSDSMTRQIVKAMSWEGDDSAK
ncbi:hypothetical protein DPSP01_014001 [Paraphaeosphaeria sporulosa]